MPKMLLPRPMLHKAWEGGGGGYLVETEGWTMKWSLGDVQNDQRD